MSKRPGQMPKLPNPETAAVRAASFTLQADVQFPQLTPFSTRPQQCSDGVNHSIKVALLWRSPMWVTAELLRGSCWEMLGGWPPGLGARLESRVLTGELQDPGNQGLGKSGALGYDSARNCVPP